MISLYHFLEKMERFYKIPQLDGKTLATKNKESPTLPMTKVRIKTDYIYIYI